jgi:hypothetical protein
MGVTVRRAGEYKAKTYANELRSTEYHLHLLYKVANEMPSSSVTAFFASRVSP